MTHTEFVTALQEALTDIQGDDWTTSGWVPYPGDRSKYKTAPAARVYLARHPDPHSPESRAVGCYNLNNRRMTRDHEFEDGDQELLERVHRMLKDRLGTWHWRVPKGDSVLRPEWRMNLFGDLSGSKLGSIVAKEGATTLHIGGASYRVKVGR